MSKLLKYQFRQNATSLLGALSILILIQLSLLLYTPGGEQAKAYTIMISVISYAAVCILIFVECIRGFYQSLKLPSRRLLPLGPLAYMAASLIYGLISQSVLGLIALAQAALIKHRLPHHLLHDAIASFGIGDYLAAAITGLWMFVFYCMVAYFLVTFLFSFRFKGKIPVVIIAFTLLQNVPSLIEQELFHTPVTKMTQYFSFKLYESDGAGSLTVPVNFPLKEWFMGPVLFELAIVLVLLGVTLWLMKHKVEN
ncbi:hypothetical protein [Gorillibacterium timonense]|uniref:hypothetical protein n=1 Tax=Gorillibacterium timonense TaxID=1689269 RepID=UPI00071E33F4|nr:hypothetical protein [Gorillibacterium timonense]